MCCIGKIVLVGIGHFALAVSLYYFRIKHSHPLFESGYLVLGLPALLAFSGYSYFVWSDALSPYPLALKLILVPLIALFALAFSSYCFAMLAFNVWGT
jgi:hypothetical protein